MLNYFVERKTLCITVLLFTLIFSCPIPELAKAASIFDGTYDYSYNIKINYDWQTYNIDSGLTISDGYIFSSQEARISGEVDSVGNVHFTGPCPYGDQEAVFTGTVGSDGYGQGTYSCQYNHVGRWSVNRVSGGSNGGGSNSIVDQVFDSFATLGAILGASDDSFVNATVGMVMMLVPFALVLAIGSHRVRQRRIQRLQAGQSQGGGPQPNLQRQQQKEYQVSPPASSAQQFNVQETAPPIGIDSNSHLMEAHAEVSVDSSLPSSLNLRANWTKERVNLSWDQPQIDNSEYQLDHYLISEMQYGPANTAPAKTPIAQLEPDTTRWSEVFKQTYKYNSRGDKEGYLVEAILRHISSTGNSEVLRVGGMAYAPYPPTL